METKEYFESYQEFVNSVTSNGAKDDNVFNNRFHELSEKLHGNFARLDHAVNGLTGEAGEVADVWKKIKFMGKNFDDEARNELVKELGDVCWYVFSVAAALEIDISEVIERNIEKLKARHPNGYSALYLKNKKGE